MQMSSRTKNDNYDCKSYNVSIDRRPQATKTEPCRKKSPLRIQNDWSEHISSKGLVYYYNCRTEVSQWQKPNDWTLPPMAHEEIKRLLNVKPCIGDSTISKRSFSTTQSQDTSSSPKKMKLTDSVVIEDKWPLSNNNNYNRTIKDDDVNGSKLMVPPVFNNNLEKANFNNDDMDISPSSSPLSRGSHSDERDSKKQNNFDFESTVYKAKVLPVVKTFPLLIECSSGKTVNRGLTQRYQEHGSSSNGHHSSLTHHQQSLVNILRSTLSILQLRANDNCLSVSHISDMLTRFEAVLTNGGTGHSYRSHRLQTQLLQNSSYSQCSDPRIVGKLSANINQIKELVKYVQDFMQDNYPHSAIVTPISPNYSKPVRAQHYLQILHHLVELCLSQLCPQVPSSPISVSSPGVLKDGVSTLSVCASVTPHSTADHGRPISHHGYSDNGDCYSRRADAERPKSVLCDPVMLQFVSGDLSNGYRNQLADCYVQEAQLEYYKFVRLHSVLYPELACESKKLKALVRISEINTELFRHKKVDLARLVHVLECRRLPSHLTRDSLTNG